MMKTAPRRALGFGFRFNPSDVEAVALYLRGRIVGEPLPDVAGVIHEANVYGYEPRELAAEYPRLPRTQSRFFFATCKRQKAGNGHRMSRVAGPGSWVSDAKRKDVKNGAGETIGTHETLKYVYRDKNRRTEWRMDEYRCCGMDHLAVVDGEERILCRVYVPSSSKEGSVTLQESAAGDRLLEMQEPAGAMAAVAVQQQPRREVPATAMALQQQPRRQVPATAMALQQQPRRQVPATAMAVQQQPRRQEPVAHVLPAITQPQAIRLPLRALDHPSVPRQPCVMNTQQVPTKRPAPQVVEPPRPKRMRPALAPLEVPPVPRHNVAMVGWNMPKKPSWWPAPAMPQRQPSPRATSRPRLRKSPRSRPRPVAPPPPPAAEAPTNDVIMGMDDDESCWSSFVAELENGITQEEEEEAGHAADDDGILGFAELLESELQEVPAVEEDGGKIQNNEDEGQHARSLEGFLVANERGDEVVAMDEINNIDDGTEDIDYSLPLSAYNGIQF